MCTRVVQQKIVQGRGNDGQSQCRGAAYAQSACTELPQPLKVALNAVQTYEMLLHRRKELPCLCSRAQPPFMHIKQLQVRAGLHLSQQTADGRLRGVQQLRSGGRGAGLHHGTKCFNFFKTQRAWHGAIGLMLRRKGIPTTYR